MYPKWQILPGVESVTKIDDTNYEGARRPSRTDQTQPSGKITLEEQNKDIWRAPARRSQRPYGVAP
jgi:hypothetical protein